MGNRTPVNAMDTLCCHGNDNQLECRILTCDLLTIFNRALIVGSGKCEKFTCENILIIQFTILNTTG